MTTPEVSFMYKDPQQVNIVNDTYSQPFSIQRYYINSTVTDVTIVNRSNLGYTSSANSAGHNGANLFIIRTIYTFVGKDKMVSVLNNIGTYFKAYNSENKELSLVREALLKACEYNSHMNRVDVCIEYAFSYEELQEHKKLYCPATDTLVCLGGYNANQIHPFTHEGRAYSEYQNFVDSRRVSGVFIEIVDNESSINSRFIYAAKQVVEIPIHKDPQRPSGVYFSRAINDRLNQTHLHPEFIEFSDAEDKIGLYKTKEEATSGGNPELLVKQQHLNLVMELEDIKSSNNILKENLRKTVLERESESNQLKHEQEVSKHNFDVQLTGLQRDLETAKRSNAMLNEQLAAREAVRSDHFDHASTARKDSSESLKTGLLVVTTVLALYAALAKSK